MNSKLKGLGKLILMVTMVGVVTISCQNEAEDQRIDKPKTAMIINTDRDKIDNNTDNKLKELKEEYLEHLKENNFIDLKQTDEANVQKYEDNSTRIFDKPSEKSLEMAKDYWEAIDNAEKQTGTPKWVLLGVASLEGNGLYTKNPPVPGTSMPSHLYGVNGMTFKDYGAEQIEKGFGDRASGASDHSKVGGPFKMMTTSWETWGADGNGDGVKDMYNLYDSTIGAANMLKNNYKFINNKYPDIQEDIKWIWAMNAHNAGRGGMLASVPLDSLEDFLIEDLGGIVKDKPTQAQTYAKFMNMGRGWGMREPIIEYWDSKGWKFDKPLRDEIISKTSVHLTQEVGESNPNGRWPGNLKGERTNEGYKTNRSHTHVAHREVNGKRIAMNMERLEYSVASYSIGKNMEMELEYRLFNNENIVSSKPNSVTSVGTVTYHWEKHPQRSSKSEEELQLIEGHLGEVGWKGLFPIFVQNPDLQNHSQIKWKFDGRNTTLGKSGCSIYAITSLIHGAGYGQYPIPGTDLPVTIENIAEVFNNGPVIYSDLMRQGYKVQLQSTKTTKDLDDLFKHIQSGIPYVINTRSGEVVGYTKTGEEVSTRFTNGGHFVLATSGFTKSGTRYIEVVQSSRSHASTKGEANDQNKLAFNYDLLVKNGIIRSSGGYPVPAFTITGIEGTEEESNYLKPTYISPKEVGDKEFGVNTTTKIDRESVKNETYNSITLDYLETLTDEEGYLRADENIYSPENILVSYVDNDLYIYLDYINGIKIGNVINTPIIEGVMKEGTLLGTTTKDTYMEFVIRDHDNSRWIKIIDAYEVTD